MYRVHVYVMHIFTTERIILKGQNSDMHKCKQSFFSIESQYILNYIVSSLKYLIVLFPLFYVFL